MMNSWKIRCTLCGNNITHEPNHLTQNCPAIHDSQVKIKDVKGRPIKNRKAKRLFAIGEVFDTKD